MITKQARSTVKIAKETASSWSSENQYHKDNVNVAMGPRAGNHGTPEKRSDFVAAKAEREPLADSILAAYGERAQRDYVDPKMEGIRPVVKPHKFSR
jgi:hypothetical protein